MHARTIAVLGAGVLDSIDEGIATYEEVDQIMTDCFRWPSGSFLMAKGARSGWSK
jgi:3-hydroxyacyl-CoA dehydrogenase